mgnify:CR=1 FL=1
MKTFKEARTYFESHLLEEATARDFERRSFNGYWKSSMKRTCKFCALAFIAGIVFMNLSDKFDEKIYMYFGQVLLFGSFIYFFYSLIATGFAFNRKFKRFQEKFRATVAFPFINYIAPELTLSSGVEVDSEEVFGSLVTPITYRLDRRELKAEHITYGLECDDAMEGQFGSLKGNAKVLGFINWGNQTEHELMGGLFFKATLDRELAGRIFIEREYIENLVGGKISGLFDKLKEFKMVNHRDPDSEYTAEMNKLSIVRLDDYPEFEKKFRVKATSPELAREFLTPERISYLQSLEEAEELPFSLSFYGRSFAAYFTRYNNKVFTVAQRELAREAMDFVKIKEIYQDVALLNNLGEGLQLKN